METSLTFGTLTALFGVMVVLSAIPSTSILTVTARSMASGFIHGVFTAVGIVVGDIIFILIAISGLTFLAEAMGDMFVLVKYIGGIYLVWLGIYLYRSGTKPVEASRFQKLPAYPASWQVCCSHSVIRRRSCFIWHSSLHLLIYTQYQFLIPPLLSR